MAGEVCPEFPSAAAPAKGNPLHKTTAWKREGILEQSKLGAERNRLKMTLSGSVSAASLDLQPDAPAAELFPLLPAPAPRRGDGSPSRSLQGPESLVGGSSCSFHALFPLSQFQQVFHGCSLVLNVLFLAVPVQATLGNWGGSSGTR